MRNAGLDTTRPVESACEVPKGAGVPGVAVGGFIDHHWVADGVDVTD
jgi:hypothetical protein